MGEVRKGKLSFYGFNHSWNINSPSKVQFTSSYFKIPFCSVVTHLLFMTSYFVRPEGQEK